MANPSIIIILMNFAFPSDVANLAMEPRPVYRRRDLLIRTSLKEGVEGKVRELDPELLKKFGHLQHQKYQDPTDDKSLLPTAFDTDTIK